MQIRLFFRTFASQRKTGIMIIENLQCRAMWCRARLLLRVAAVWCAIATG